MSGGELSTATAELRATALAAWMRHHFLLLLLAVYVVAVAIPWPGMWLRDAEFGERLPLTRILLAILLANAGLSVSPRRMSESSARLRLPLIAVTSRFFVAGAYAWLAAWCMPESMGEVAIGLALMAVVPAAGSSPAWTQASSGRVSISLWIVGLSTLLSPVWGGLLFRAVGPLLGDADHRLASAELLAKMSDVVVWGWILLPPAAAMAARGVLGEERVASWRPWVSLTNLVLLLVLIYAFAAAAMGRVVADGRYGLLATSAAAAAVMAATGFTAAASIGWRLTRDPAERVALLYGIGMQNNGVAMLIGGVVLAADSPAFLPMIAHALTQHLAAGSAAMVLERSQEESG